jgi:hypothetical protein
VDFLHYKKTPATYYGSVGIKNINLEEPVRVASPTRINLEEPVRVASPTRINSFLCPSIHLSVCEG